MGERRLLRRDEPVLIPADGTLLDGRITIPYRARAGVVIVSVGKLVHNSKDRESASRLGKRGIAVLLVDLLSRDGEVVALRHDAYPFDEMILRRRLRSVVRWLASEMPHLELSIMADAWDPAGAMLLQRAVEVVGSTLERPIAATDVHSRRERTVSPEQRPSL